jgi:chromosomal replication initiation ATPase DnaA
MNHSLHVILDYVGHFYEMSTEDITRESQKQEIVKARKMLILLAKGNKDGMVAKFLGLSRPHIVNSRKSILNEMEFNKELKAEYEQAEHNLLLYEVADLRMNQNI